MHTIFFFYNLKNVTSNQDLEQEVCKITGLYYLAFTMHFYLDWQNLFWRLVLK